MTFSVDDTIVAIATPAGRGGIGMVRISGVSAAAIAITLLGRVDPLEPRRATFAKLRNASVADDVVATYFPAPHSYTGQDVVELSAHGSPVVLAGIVETAIAAGARLAAPGEFTLRGFLHGKRDLVQAEAVADLIDASTPLQARVAFDQLDGTLTRRIASIDGELFDLIARLEGSLDFPDEGYHFIEPEQVVERIDGLVSRAESLLADGRRGRMIREGALVAIAGRPNVGKSSIFNALCGADRAIVTDVPGTTRDMVTERVNIEGLAITLVDTAGWHDTTDIVEREGVARAASARERADLVLLVLDRSEPLTRDDCELLEQTAHRARVVLLNKCDRRPAALPVGDAVEVSATGGIGLDRVRAAIARELTGAEALQDGASISNVRQIALLEQVRHHFYTARSAAAAAAPEEMLLADLQAGRALLDEVVGVRTSEDVLQHIFERFCVGK